MDRRRSLATIDATLRHAGFTPAGSGVADYNGQIKVHGKPVDVTVCIPDVWFATKPRVILRDQSQIPVETLAHVEEETGICYASGAGLPLDLYEPGQAILRVLEEARATLELSYGGKGREEVIDEYQSYWKSKLPVHCMIPREGVMDGSQATLFFACQDGEAQFVAISEQPELRGYESTLPKKVVFWKTEKLIGPVGKIVAPQTLAQLKVWLEGHVDLAGRDWNQLVQLLCSKQHFFLAAPNALVGLAISLPPDLKSASQKGTIRPVALPKIVEKYANRVELDRYSGRWSSLTSVTNRNNQNEKDLSEKSIALVGCGTVGSHLARMLTQVGAGNGQSFSIFDNQYLSQGNIGRHLLGFGAIGKAKATAVGAELERFHPQVKLAVYEQDALEHLTELAKHELVIDATGEWNVQSALNEWFIGSDKKATAALLHCWVFMNGAGVQSFLNLNDEFACFRCLRPKFDGQWRFPVGDEKEELNLRPATCGDGSFVPFTVDAPVMAASLALRAALDWVNGDPGPRLRSAVVDLRRGRFQEPKNPSPAKTCPACAARRGGS